MSAPGAASRSRAAGFTLLEVMLAFVLLAVAMGLLVAMLANGLRQVRQAEAETEATLHAQSLLDQVGVLEPLLPGQRSGGFDQDRYRYQLKISEARDPAPPPTPEPGGVVATGAEAVGGPKLYRVELTVTWGAGQPSQQLHFVTLRSRVPEVVAASAP